MFRSFFSRLWPMCTYRSSPGWLPTECQRNNVNTFNLQPSPVTQAANPTTAAAVTSLGTSVRLSTTLSQPHSTAMNQKVSNASVFLFHLYLSYFNLLFLSSMMNALIESEASQAFFVQNPSHYVLMKCGTRQFWRFENEFQHFENEFHPFWKAVS